MMRNEKKVEAMTQGGKILADIRNKLMAKIDVGVSAAEIEDLACKLIKSAGGKPSFKMVPNYKWATCINVNEGVVHGIPKKEIVFRDGDLVSVDVGFYYKDFHTDTSSTICVGRQNKKKEKFLASGRKALERAIKAVKANVRVGEISQAIETSLVNDGFYPVKELTGHAIGSQLHERPFIPCFLDRDVGETDLIPQGAALALEVMYTDKKSSLKLASDGWTIASSRGTMAGLFEETVLVAKNGAVVLTDNTANPNNELNLI